MSGYTFAWLMWIGFFGVIEATALITKSYEGTLTRHIRSWFAVKGKPPAWLARRGVLFASLVWLLLHLMGWIA